MSIGRKPRQDSRKTEIEREPLRGPPAGLRNRFLNTRNSNSRSSEKRREMLEGKPSKERRSSKMSSNESLVISLELSKSRDRGFCNISDP